MSKNEVQSELTNEFIVNKIYLIRGNKVMLDSDLAELYGIETKRLKEQVKRNIVRFPSHFMFELTAKENDVLRSQIATLKQGAHSKYLPFAFTEHGVLQLSNVIKSGKAIEISIRIIEVFVKLREVLATHTELKLEVEKIKNTLENQGKNMELIFQYLDELIDKNENQEPRKKIGFNNK
jgi:phage regulator Rha-like protein